MATSGESSLFGPRPSVATEAATLLDDAGDVATEPAVDAVVRLGQGRNSIDILGMSLVMFGGLRHV